ncbi:MAG: hypothetical protein MUP19_10145 [Candidatus Aminicenantes bacterium]|nr:hypothetical protein [Candidatus Aminicenantes bacterium]
MAKKFDYRRMKPIWYFVGLILVSMGVVINLTGIYDLFRGGEGDKVLGSLHPNIWWGELMAVVGGLFIFFNRKAASADRAPVKTTRKKHA